MIKLTELQKEVIREIKSKSILLYLPTGYGKTVLGIYISNLIEGRKLILTPRKIIREQWLNQINNFSPDKRADFEIELQISFSKRQHTNPDYSCVIIDECHMNEQTVFYKIIPKIKAKILIGLSASPSITNFEYFKQTISRHITRPFAVTPIFLTFKPTIFYVWRQGKKTFHYTKILKSLFQNQYRLEFIGKKILEIFNERKVESLIITKNIKTVEYLEKLLTGVTTVDTLYGKKNNYDKSATVLIGTYQKMGVGFDSFIYKNLFLLDNLKDIIQAEGRLRNSCFQLYDFIDDHFLFTRHWYERLEWYKKRGGHVSV